MRNVNISNDIIPVAEFKAGMKRYLNSIKNSHHPIVITQNGRAAGVLISPEDYDTLIQNKLFLESVNRGLSEAENGNLYSTEEAKAGLLKNRSVRSEK